MNIAAHFFFFFFLFGPSYGVPRTQRELELQPMPRLWPPTAPGRGSNPHPYHCRDTVNPTAPQWELRLVSILLRIFASMFISDPGLWFSFFFLWYFCLVLISKWWGPHTITLEVLLPLQYCGIVSEGWECVHTQWEHFLPKLNMPAVL